MSLLMASMSLMSCEESSNDSNPEGKSYYKTIQVSLDSKTKAVNESAINDVTVFVYQKNVATGETKLFDRKYGSESSYQFELLFSELVPYSYDVKAYANMGELDAEPEEILFSNEKENGVQLHGEIASISETSEDEVLVDMRRYIGKITVKKIEMALNEDTSGLDMKIVSMYLVNVAEKLGGEAYYNTDGYHTESEMDGFLYREVNIPLSNDTYSSTAISLFGYVTESSALVFECEINGAKMYYNIPFTSTSNMHSIYNVTISQRGSATPFGDPIEDNIDANRVGFNVIDYDVYSENITIGEKPGVDVEVTLPEE